MPRKITQTELNRRIDGRLRDGQIGIREARRGEIILIHTEPAIYEIEVVSPACMLVNITSMQDPTFERRKPCRFLGSIWDNVQDITCWEEAPMGVYGTILNNCYLVVELLGRTLVLPKIYFGAHC